MHLRFSRLERTLDRGLLWRSGGAGLAGVAGAAIGPGRISRAACPAGGRTIGEGAAAVAAVAAGGDSVSGGERLPASAALPAVAEGAGVNAAVAAVAGGAPDKRIGI